MGYIQEARENHVKKKVEEGTALTYNHLLNPNKTLFFFFFFFAKRNNLC
jgi:hypothetical protein